MLEQENFGTGLLLTCSAFDSNPIGTAQFDPVYSNVLRIDQSDPGRMASMSTLSEVRVFCCSGLFEVCLLVARRLVAPFASRTHGTCLQGFRPRGVTAGLCQFIQV